VFKLRGGVFRNKGVMFMLRGSVYTKGVVFHIEGALLRGSCLC